MDEFRRDLSQVVGVPIPAAGEGFTFAPSGAEYSRLRLVTFAFTTSATVASRVVALTVLDGSGQPLATIPSPAAQTAGQTATYTFGLDLYPYSVDAANAVVAPLPDLWLRLGQSVEATVAAIDSADTLTDIRVVLDQVGFLEARGE